MARTAVPEKVRPRSRRAPTVAERQRDAGRSREGLLAAALEEFAAKGYAGARVRDIADRAGVNKQLVTYYFGSKDGLYRELQRRWLADESVLVASDLDLDELVARYLQDALRDPRLMRLLVWRGLTHPAKRPPDVTPPREDLSSMRRRQDRGELDENLDTGCVLLAIMGMVAAPVAMPHMVQRILGVDPASPKFAAQYGDQLRRIVHHLASPPAPTPRRPSRRPGTR